MRERSIEAAKVFEEIFALRTYFSSPKSYLYSHSRLPTNSILVLNSRWQMFATTAIVTTTAVAAEAAKLFAVDMEKCPNLSCQLNNRDTKMVVEQYDYYFQLKFDYY